MIGPWLPYDKPNQRWIDPIFAPDDYRGISYAVTSAQSCFGFTRIHPLTPNFDLPIIAPAELSHSIRAKADEITRMKNPKRGIRAVAAERSGLKSAVLPNAKRNVATLDHQLADLTSWYCCAVLSDEGESDAGCSVAARGAKWIADSRSREPLEESWDFGRSEAQKNMACRRKCRFKEF
jgi:hypothetical protein